MADRPSLFAGPSAETTPQDWTEAPPPAPPTPGGPAPAWPWGSGDLSRYTLAPGVALGEGGMGSVWRVHDRWLCRDVAMKVIHQERLGPGGTAAFVREARTAAGLQHPAIVPLLDVGVDGEGRGWYTMPIVEGRPLTEVIAEAHRAGRPAPEGWAVGPDLRGLLGAFATVCEAIAYAHSREVLHLDLKPGNVMLGAFGQVTVMDWGLTRAPGELSEGRWGTPAYVAPEALIGGPCALSVTLDVYGLGALLFELLSGRPPRMGRTWAEVCAEQEAGPVMPVANAAQPMKVPDELAALCDAALSADPGGRPAAASALAQGIRSWLDGARRRDQAAEVAASARELPGQIAQTREEAQALRQEATVLSASIPRYAPIEQKRPIWALESRAEAREAEANRLELVWLRAMQGALKLDPDQPEAHARLADHHQRRHASAERAGDQGQEMHERAALEEHDRTGRHQAYLRGDGRLTLLTEPPGARVTVSRYVEVDRRLVPLKVAELGPTPIVDAPLAAGRYLLELESPGREPLRLPVAIARGGTWMNARPGEEVPQPVRLLPRGALGPDEVYVPEGAFWCGGDPKAPRSLPGRQIWLDGFIIKRYPVTCQEYCDFLNDLVAQGREDAARAAWPGKELLPLREDGTPGFQVGPDVDRHPIDPRRPVVQVNLFDATAYAHWVGHRTGLPWQIPGELALEKAARGTDGRAFPWGEAFDPTWCNMSESAPTPGPVPVVETPTDVSPWEVCGLAGNVVWWTSDVYHLLGPSPPKALPDAKAERVVPDTRMVVRGGAYTSVEGLCRGAARLTFMSQHRSPALGFGLARPITDLPYAPITVQNQTPRST